MPMYYNFKGWEIQTKIKKFFNNLDAAEDKSCCY